ncbi:hypothetical protein Bbelb_242010 [Branchiostoma belcheri]|nr:hypothetical protein Bbelb_242010 [Branchiostoma belcheri]
MFCIICSPTAIRIPNHRQIRPADREKQLLTEMFRTIVKPPRGRISPSPEPVVGSSWCGDVFTFPSTITQHDYVRLETTLTSPLTAVTACVRLRTDAEEGQLIQVEFGSLVKIRILRVEHSNLTKFMNDSSYHGNVIDWETVGKLVYGGVQLYQVDCETSLGKDPCNISDDEICDTAYNNTITDPNRSTAFVPGSSDPFICDNSLTKGWYRFEAHSQSVKIPEQCVEPYHCGTHFPLWLDGPHPINSQVADRDVCANYGRPGDCCSDTISIRVKKCTEDGGKNFYAYCLSPARACNQAYCAGK